jgi:hypothetical protein
MAAVLIDNRTGDNSPVRLHDFKNDSGCGYGLNHVKAATVDRLAV